MHNVESSTTESRYNEKLPRPCVTAEKKELYFNCVYTDLIGPMQTKSTKGYFYGVTFTEMATRNRFFYPLKKKSETLSAFEQLNADVIGMGYKIKMLKSDNGGEYTSDAFKSYCKVTEITQRLPLHTPHSLTLYQSVLTECWGNTLDPC